MHSLGYIDRFLSEEKEQEAVEIEELESMLTEPTREEKERIGNRLFNKFRSLISESLISEYQ